jgi:hypothetical protein
MWQIWGRKNAYRILVGSLKERDYEVDIHICEDNIKMEL